MTRPNLVFVLIDDLGWRDLGCYGSTFHETPNLDKLAAEGISFTDAYAACPVCSPTRASILTGKYPVNVGVTDWIDWGKGTHPCRGKLIDAPYVDHLPYPTAQSRFRAVARVGRQCALGLINDVWRSFADQSTRYSTDGSRMTT